MCVSWAWTSVSIESKMGKMQGIEDTVMTRTVNPRASCLNIEGSSVEAGHDSGRGPRQQLNGSEDGRCVLSALEPHGKRRQALTPMMMGVQPRDHWRRLWKPGWVGGEGCVVVVSRGSRNPLSWSHGLLLRQPWKWRKQLDSAHATRRPGSFSGAYCRVPCACASQFQGMGHLQHLRTTPGPPHTRGSSTPAPKISSLPLPSWLIQCGTHLDQV